MRQTRGKEAQVGCAVNATSASYADSTAANRNTQHTVAYTVQLFGETPRAGQDADDTAHVPDIGVDTSHTNASPRHLTPHSANQRLKLLVDTGSGQIVMTGEVASDELYCSTTLQGVLQNNEEVELVNDLEEGVEIVNMTQSILLSDENQMHYAGTKVENKEDDL